MNFKILFLLFFIIPLSAFSQLNYNKEFTRADSLRGTLSEFRSNFDVIFYHLNIRLDIQARSISGYNLIDFVTTRETGKIQLDLYDNMNVDSIIFGEKIKLDYAREYNAVFIDLPFTASAGERYSIKFYYSGKPIEAPSPPWDGGFVWSRDKNGKPWISTAVQGEGASLFWPNKDHQSDEPDSMMISVTVPKGLMDVSNGRLRSVVKKENETQYNWFVSNKINNYGVVLNVGDYSHFSDHYVNENGDTLDLDYYVMPYNVESAKKHFQEVKQMLECFEKYFGKYPFYEDGFKLVESPYFGMEHQSAIAYGNEFKKGMKGRSIADAGMLFDYIIIHEAAHEWWGNSVTSNDIADMWIHESFGTYSESIFIECLYGKEKAVEYINDHKSSVKNDRPVIGPRNVNTPGSGDMYRKGSLMLNTLRHVINDDELWFKILKGIAENFYHSNIDAEDIISYINEKSGKDYTYIFDQYLRYSDVPTLELNIQQTGNDTNVKYRWKADVKDFRMSVKVYTNGKSFFLYPDTKWKEIILENTNEEDIKVAEDEFYINIKTEIS